MGKDDLKLKTWSTQYIYELTEGRELEAEDQIKEGQSGWTGWLRIHEGLATLNQIGAY